MVKYIDGNYLTKDTVIEQYEKLVFKHANRLSGGDHHFMQDLSQEGFIGLLYAFDRYDITSGYKFITYATPYVRGYMMRMHNKRGIVYTPRNVVNTAWAIERNELWELADEEIAEQLKVSVHRVKCSRIYFKSIHTESMDKERSTIDEEGASYYNILSYNEDYTAPIVEEYKQLLTDRELFIVNRLLDGYNQKEIGEFLGVTRAGISYNVKGIKKKINQLN